MEPKEFKKKLEDYINKTINDYFYKHPEGNLTWDDESFDAIKFYYSESEEEAFRWYGNEYFDSYDPRTPLVVVSQEAEDYFNGLFNKVWHEPFKKWLDHNFSLEVKTIE